VKTLQIVGRKKSGKTSLVVRLLPLLQANGLRVGTVKHSSHPYPLDREGSDSWLHRGAGAQVTLAISAVAASLHFPVPEDETDIQALVETHLGGLDLVLIEGWAARRGPRIEVVPADKEGAPRAPANLEGGELLAVVLSPGLRPAGELLAPWGELHAIGDAVDLSALAARALSGTPVPCFLWDDVQTVARLVLEWSGRKA
jgi:molybdopterin-guanine dinucleotide biosynthesis adapter protein